MKALLLRVRKRDGNFSYAHTNFPGIGISEISTAKQWKIYYSALYQNIFL